MKGVPQTSDVIAFLQRMNFGRRDELRDGIWDLHRGALSRIRVTVTDEGAPGEYLHTTIMVETAKGSFEDVATFSSFAPIGLIERSVRSVVMMDKTTI